MRIRLCQWGRSARERDRRLRRIQNRACRADSFVLGSGQARFVRDPLVEPRAHVRGHLRRPQESRPPPAPKADEYSKPDQNGIYSLLLCRVLGGRVFHTDVLEPDPEELVRSCISGRYDSVCGDREKCRGTYREFVLFDSEDAYAEYEIQYTRVY